jgi:hypothetical protein
MASKTIIDMVIKTKNHLTGNWNPATRNIGKHSTNWGIMVDNISSLLLWDLWSNSEESGKQNCVLQRNSGVPKPNIFCQEVWEWSTALLQNWNRIRWFQFTKFPC